MPRHVIANYCLSLKHKEQAQPTSHLSQTIGIVGKMFTVSCNTEPVNDCFKPFLFDTLVSINGNPGEPCAYFMGHSLLPKCHSLLFLILTFSKPYAHGYNTKLCLGVIGLWKIQNQ